MTHANLSVTLPSVPKLSYCAAAHLQLIAVGRQLRTCRLDQHLTYAALKARGINSREITRAERGEGGLVGAMKVAQALGGMLDLRFRLASSGARHTLEKE